MANSKQLPTSHQENVMKPNACFAQCQSHPCSWLAAGGLSCLTCWTTCWTTGLGPAWFTDLLFAGPVPVKQQLKGAHPKLKISQCSVEQWRTVLEFHVCQHVFANVGNAAIEPIKDVVFKGWDLRQAQRTHAGPLLDICSTSVDDDHLLLTAKRYWKEQAEGATTNKSFAL